MYSLNWEVTKSFYPEDLYPDIPIVTAGLSVKIGRDSNQPPARGGPRVRDDLADNF